MEGIKVGSIRSSTVTVSVFHSTTVFTSFILFTIGGSAKELMPDLDRLVVLPLHLDSLNRHLTVTVVMLGTFSPSVSASKIYINLVEFYCKRSIPQPRIFSQSFRLSSSQLFALLHTLSHRKLPMQSPASASSDTTTNNHLVLLPQKDAYPQIYLARRARLRCHDRREPS
jgi:hypothetical protein